MSGTATHGSDYSTISSPATIAAGSSYVDLTLTPVQDDLDEEDEAALLTLSANAAYTVGSPDSATITIQDDDDPPPPSDACVSNLIAGGGNSKGALDVGEVQVWQEGMNLMVMYLIDEPGCASHPGASRYQQDLQRQPRSLPGHAGNREIHPLPFPGGRPRHA